MITPGAVRLACVALLGCSGLVAAACGDEEPQARALVAARPTVPRESFDPREQVLRGDPMLLRLDDLAAQATFSAEPSAASDAPDRVWEFDSGAEGWTLLDGDDPEAPGGQVSWSVEAGREGIVSPEMDVPFRDLRAIEIRLKASAGTRLKLWWAEKNVMIPSHASDWKRMKLKLRNLFVENNRFNVKYAITSEIVPGESVLSYSVRTSSLRGYEGMRLAWLRLDPTDGAAADVSIESIRLIGREGSYRGRGHGIAQENLDNKIRNVLFHRAPSSASWTLTLPPAARFDAGAGLLQARAGATFVVSVEADGRTTEVLRTPIADDAAWRDLTADLSAWAGRTVRFTLAAESTTPGQVILWSNPMIGPDPAAVIAGRAPAPAGGSGRPPNVIVYLIDTLRDDHLSSYGHPSPTSPTIDSLAREGALFERVAASAPWTRPAIASILTSLAPPSHGVTNYGLAMSDAVTTLAEIMRGQGYVTAGFIASTQSGSSSNLQQGYDFLDELPVISGGAEIEIANRGQAAGRAFSKTSAGINQAVLPWLETYGQRPLFLYLHVMDPHAPYDPPSPFREMFATGYSGPLTGDFDESHGFKHARTLGEIAHIKALYDGDTRYNDEQIKELTGRLRELGQLDNTIFVITSDHGEEFREHGHWEHGKNLHREVVNIPWIIRYPAAVPAGVRPGKRVGSLDVLPTILDIAGLPLSPDFQGRSRLSLIRSAATDPGSGRDDGEFIFTWRQGDNESEQVAVERGGLKLIWMDEARRELYDLRADPEEKTDIAASRPEVVEEYSRHGQAWLASRFRVTTPGESVRVTIDEEERKWLEALGYIQ